MPKARTATPWRSTRGYTSFSAMVAAIVVVVIVALATARGEADSRIDEQREQLAAFDQLGVGARLVRLDVEQEPSLAQDVGRVDDPRGFLVLGDEARVDRYWRAAVEELRVVRGDLDELARVDRIQPDLRDARAVAGILVHEDAAKPVDGHVVQHLVALVAAQQDLDGPALLGMLD